MPTDGSLSPILVTDDNSTDVFFLERRLTAAGVKGPVQHLEDGFEAMQWLAARANGASADRPRPWLMFLDLKMPGVDGFDVLKWMQDKRLNEHLTVVVLSTSDEPRDIERALGLGAHRYLVKYPEPAELAEVVAFAQRRALEGGLASVEVPGAGS